MKKIDALWDGKIRPGFEMLIDNFSAGIVGLILAVFGFFGIRPIVTAFSPRRAGQRRRLPGRPQPAAADLDLHRAGQGAVPQQRHQPRVLTPLGTTQALETGKSVLFLLEANPGPGLPNPVGPTPSSDAAPRRRRPRARRSSSSSAGSRDLLPVRADETEADRRHHPRRNDRHLHQCAVRIRAAPAAPGSIIAVLAQTATAASPVSSLSVVGAAAVSFAVASLLLKTDRSDDDGDLAAATAGYGGAEGQKSSVSSGFGGLGQSGPITSIVFACDAGMGSSAMGASGAAQRRCRVRVSPTSR